MARRPLGMTPLPPNADISMLIRHINELTDFVARSSKEGSFLSGPDYSAQLQDLDTRVSKIEGDIYGSIE